MHPLGAGSGVAVVSEDGELLRPQGMECYFPAPDSVQRTTEPLALSPDNSNVTPETVDINISKQWVKPAGFDHLGFDEVTFVEVEYCALPVDVVNNCNSTAPLDMHLATHASRYDKAACRLRNFAGPLTSGGNITIFTSLGL